MEIKDLSKTVRPACSSPVEGMPVELAAEHVISVFVNEQPAMRLVCTPEHLDELVLGRLLSEGIIASAESVASVYICEQGLRARVLLHNRAALRPAAMETVSTCCTDNRILLEKEGGPLPQVKPIRWEAGWLQKLATRMQEEEPLYLCTHAVHGCYLARQDEILSCREDLGRHNAMDKAIGWALIHGVNLRECSLFTTGRMPLDMVTKAIRSGVPVLASKTYPTEQAVSLAKESSLTLVTVNRYGLQVWNGPEAAEN